MVAASVMVSLIGAWGETVSTIVVTVLVLIFGEYLPKAWFHARPLQRCRRFAGLLRGSELLFRPIAAGMVWLTRWLVPGPQLAFSKPLPFVTREDLKILAREGEKNGVLSRRERVMIHRVFELSGKRAHEIMVPRDEMVTVDLDTTVEQFYQTARESGFTRMPVHDKSNGAFVGIINVFYVLSTCQQEAEKQTAVSAFLRPPLFIPAGMPVDDILPRMRLAREPMGLVVGEGQQVVGLVTTEDILEEIVGELSR